MFVLWELFHDAYCSVGFAQAFNYCVCQQDATPNVNNDRLKILSAFCFRVRVISVDMNFPVM